MIFLLLLSSLISTRGYASLFDVQERNPCIRGDVIRWKYGVYEEIRSVNLTSCEEGVNRIEITRPRNSCKHIRIRIIAYEVDNESDLKIHVFEEGTTMEGRREEFARKKLIGVNATVVSSPFTHLKLHLTKRGITGRAEVTFLITLEDDGCPYPLLNVQPGIPLEISSKVLAFGCDFVILPSPYGEILELTSPNVSLSYSMQIYDGYHTTTPSFITIIQRERERFNHTVIEGDLNLRLDTSMAAIHVFKGESAVEDHNAVLMVIKSIVDECPCPEDVIVFDEPDDVYTLKMKRRHCMEEKCSITVKLAAPLQSNYRFKIRGSNLVIKDGASHLGLMYANGVHYRLQWLDEGYYSFSNKLGITFEQEELYVSLINTTVEEKSLCACPLFHHSILVMNIDATCPRMDCIWTLPRAEFESTTIKVLTNSSDAFDKLFMMTNHENGFYQRVNLENGFHDRFGLSRYNKDIVFHFRRLVDHNVDGFKQIANSYYKLEISSANSTHLVE